MAPAAAPPAAAALVAAAAGAAAAAALVAVALRSRARAHARASGEREPASGAAGVAAASTASAPLPTPTPTPTPAPLPTPDATHAERVAASSRYFTMVMLGPLPSKAQAQDPSRATALYFAVQALEALGALPKALAAVVPKHKDAERGRAAVADWLYALQCAGGGGFVGSPAEPLGVREGHVVATYSALATLLTLGDDLARVERGPLLRWLASLQDPRSGCFRATRLAPEEADLRFSYAALASCRLLGGDARALLDVDALARYCAACRNLDGGYGLTPGAESHGGATYTAVATLLLAGRPLGAADARETARFCAELQSALDGGFRGRPGKDSDVCYGFWVGATLVMLGLDRLVDRGALRAFVVSAASPIGGFAKVPGDMPDPLHAMFGVWCEERLCGAGARREALGVDALSAALGVSLATTARLRRG